MERRQKENIKQQNTGKAAQKLSLKVLRKEGYTESATKAAPIKTASVMLINCMCNSVPHHN